jgi:hypothetical protein
MRASVPFYPAMFFTCPCERSEAIFPCRLLTLTKFEGKIASLRSQGIDAQNDAKTMLQSSQNHAISARRRQ